MDRRKIANIVTGTFLVIAGILALGQATRLWDLALLMNGWWTIFLIVPAIAGMIINGPRVGNIMLLVLGIWLFADCQGWFGHIGWALIPGALLLAWGVRVITRKDDPRRRHHHRYDRYDDEQQSNTVNQ